MAIGRKIGVGVITTFAALVTYFIVVSAPASFYYLDSFAHSTDCQSVKPGMTKAEVLRLFHAKTEPTVEAESEGPNGHELFFRRKSDECRIAFDTNGNVKTAGPPTATSNVELR